MSKTALLLSGGLDSTAIAFWKKPDIAYTIDYGQQCAQAEIQASTTICNELSIQHEIIQIDCSSLGSGDLAGSDAHESAPCPEWWPYRNQLLITFAVMKAISQKVSNLMLGSIKSDSTHTDGTDDFYKKIDAVVAMQEGNIHIDVPAIHLESTELIRTSKVDISLLSWSHSCHKSNLACGACRGCYKHQNVMKELGYEFY